MLLRYRYVKDTNAETLKSEISMVLSQHILRIQDIHAQRYDGASNSMESGMDLKPYFLVIVHM